jgi:GH35 family endo-1,4-beta-xylanase
MSTNLSNEYKHRIGTTALKLVGTDGTPLKNKEITVEQTKHEFLFGCGEFSAIRFVHNEFKGDEKEKVEFRLEKFCDLFNYATLPFYWEFFEPVKGEPDTKRLKQAAQWLSSKGLTLKGHPLCWHTLAAPWLLDMSNAEILSTQLSRINREVTEFTGLIDTLDVINEVVIMQIFNKYYNGITSICKDI